MERVNVATIGDGPAGTSATHAAASTGASVMVLEKNVPRADQPGLGPDLTNAAGILDYWVDIISIHPDELSDVTVLDILDRAEFIGPNESLTLQSTGINSPYDESGYTFHRVEFDDRLRSRAEDAGAEYRVKASVRDVEADLDAAADDVRHVARLANGEDVGAEFVVLADGPQRTVTNKVLDDPLPFPITDRLPPTEANHVTYQEHREFPPELFDEVDGATKSWWGYTPGHTAYLWVFPNDDNVCRASPTTPISPDIDEADDRDVYALLRKDDERILQGREYVRRLLEQEYDNEYGIDEDLPFVEGHGRTKGTETYAISSTRPIDSPAEAGIVITGGVVGTTSTFHEDGNHVAIRIGAIAGELTAKGDPSDYNERWKEAIGDEILCNVAMAEIVHDYSPAQWDKMSKAVRKLLEKDEGYKASGAAELNAGFSAAKLATQYQRTKVKYRKGKHVQLREDEYAL